MLFSLLEIADLCYSSFQISTACTIFMKFISTGEWNFLIGIVQLSWCISPSNRQSCLGYRVWKFAFFSAVLRASFYRGRDLVNTWSFCQSRSFGLKEEKPKQGRPFSIWFPSDVPQKFNICPRFPIQWQNPTFKLSIILLFQVLLLLTGKYYLFHYAILALLFLGFTNKYKQ